MAARLLGKEEDRVQIPDGPSTKAAERIARMKAEDERNELSFMGCSSNGKTPALQAGNRGPTPRRSTATHGLMVQRDDTRLAVWRSEFDSRWVHWGIIRKVAGYGWPGRSAKAVLARRDEGSTPLPSACDANGRLAPMVKWRSCLASNETFRVRLLVGVLLSFRVAEFQS